MRSVWKLQLWWRWWWWRRRWLHRSDSVLRWEDWPVGALLISARPIEVLNGAPKIAALLAAAIASSSLSSSSSVLAEVCLQMSCQLGILKIVGCHPQATAVFYDGLTASEQIEIAVQSVVNAQLKRKRMRWDEDKDKDKVEGEEKKL